MSEDEEPRRRGPVLIELDADEEAPGPGDVPPVPDAIGPMGEEPRGQAMQMSQSQGRIARSFAAAHIMELALFDLDNTLLALLAPLIGALDELLLTPLFDGLASLADFEF